MKNPNINKLVSLILEEIQKTQETEKPLFFNDLGSIEQYFGDSGNPDESEIDEMARNVHPVEKLPQPMIIPISEIGNRNNLPKIVSKNPETGEMVNDVIIGDTVLSMPSGDHKVLQFHNYGEPYANERQQYTTRYIVLTGSLMNQYRGAVPQSSEYGTERNPVDLSIEPEGETEEDKALRISKGGRRNEEYAKRYVIFPTVNKFFARKEILNRLDVSLIPETWAEAPRTERTTNKQIRLQFGGNGKSINAEFYAVKDIDNIESALDEIIKNRMDIEDGIENRERNRSKTKPREYANYIYTQGGNWDAIQRIYDEEHFKNAGEYTAILKLLKQNIQKGQKGLNVKSKLSIQGDVEGNQYVLKARFSATLNYRPVGVGAGVKAGDLIDPIDVVVRKTISKDDLQNPMFSIKTNKNFFGKPSGKGIFNILMTELGNEMIDKINPDVVLNKITDLLIPTNIDKEFQDTDF